MMSGDEEYLGRNEGRLSISGDEAQGTLTVLKTILSKNKDC